MTAIVFPSATRRTSAFVGVRLPHTPSPGAGLPGDETAGRFTTTGGAFEARLGNTRPSHAVYVRRRLLVGLVLVAVFVLVGITASSVLADRGAVPASSPAVRPALAISAAQSPVTLGVPSASAHADPNAVYVVQPGETIWAIAERFHGRDGVAAYVEALIASNGGSTSLQIGQALTLP